MRYRHGEMACASNTVWADSSLSPTLSLSLSLLFPLGSSPQENLTIRGGGEVCNWRNICGLRGGINVCYLSLVLTHSALRVLSRCVCLPLCLCVELARATTSRNNPLFFGSLPLSLLSSSRALFHSTNHRVRLVLTIAYARARTLTHFYSRSRTTTDSNNVSQKKVKWMRKLKRQL